MSYILGGGSTGKCYLCGTTTSKFNEITDVLQKPINDQFLLLGFPVLHAKIRLMESVLRVSKKLKIKQYMVLKYFIRILKHACKKMTLANAYF